MLTVLSVGCTTAISNPKCPVLIKYSAEFQKKAAASLKARKDDKEVTQLVNDYGKLRDACRSLK